MRSTMEVTPEIIDCWRINYGLDKTPHELCAFWNDRVPSGAVMALKVACDEIIRLQSLRKDAERYRWLRNASMDERNRLEHYAGPELDKVLDARPAVGAA